jgi:hypothetical protein
MGRVIIGRRTLVIAGGAFFLTRPIWADPDAATPAATAAPSSGKSGLMATPPGKVLGFDVVRDKSKIGTHVLTFDQDGDNLTINVAVELKVGVGPITLFRYKHKAVEVWKNGILFSLDTETNDDGTPNIVTGRRTETGFTVEGTKAKLYTAPDDAIPATHWNRNQLNGPWINTQDGRLLHPIITPMGNDAIPTADGGTLMANHFALKGDAVLDTWYDATRNWAGLSFKAGDGSSIVYERV